MIESRQYDVVVIGGGPAGACAATLVAEKGHRVLLLEREPRPGFKVGESLMPATYWSLERLGLLDRMKGSFFPNKNSVQFFTADNRPSAPFYFKETDSHESSGTWQVLRSEFDELLLDNAREKGVEVAFGSTVREVRLDGDRATGVVVATKEGDIEISSRVVVDASGQSSFLARKLGLREEDPRLKNASYYTHYKGAKRDSGIDEGATLIYRTVTPGCWLWFIPLPNDRASVGLVGPVDEIVHRRKAGPQQVFDDELALCPALAERLAGAEQVVDMKVVKTFSYSSSRLAGDGWVLIGDAYGFLDPIYSSGVFLALKSGEFAADAILDGLETGDLSGRQLGRFEEEYQAGMHAIRSLVEAYYDPEFSFGRFLKKHPDMRLPVIDLLVGNIFRKPLGDLEQALTDMMAERRPDASQREAG